MPTGRSLLHAHGDGPGTGTGPRDGHLIAHAVVMSLMVVGAFPWLYWATQRNRTLHIAAAPWVASLMVVALVHAFVAVEGPGAHAAAHSALGICAAAAILGQAAAGFLRSNPKARLAHIWGGRLLVGAILPVQWLLGIQAACADTSTALVGHGTVSAFTAAYALMFGSSSNRQIPEQTEAGFLVAGGAVGLVGDLLVSGAVFSERRVQHLFLYATFIAAGAIEWLTAEAAPVVVALGVFGCIIIAHQHGGHHEVELGGVAAEATAPAAGLVFGMHASSGVALLCAAAFRFLGQVRRLAGALFVFSVLFVLSQPEVCACWVAYTAAPAVYYGLALEIAAVVVGVTWAAAGGGPRYRTYTRTKFVLGPASESEDASDGASDRG